MIHLLTPHLEALAGKAAGPAISTGGAMALVLGSAGGEVPASTLIETGGLAAVAVGMVVTVRQAISAQQHAADRQAKENERDREAWKREAAETRTQHASEFAAQREEHRAVIEALFRRFDATHERHSADFRAVVEPINRLIAQNELLIDEIRAERAERAERRRDNPPGRPTP